MLMDRITRFPSTPAPSSHRSRPPSSPSPFVAPSSPSASPAPDPSAAARLASVSLPSLRKQAQEVHAPMASSQLVAQTRGTTPADLQSHLYQSFLMRKTADVALRVRGSWHAVYKLHRVVLIQAGFFQSLFTSGFAESNAKIRRHSDPDVIDIVFDDPNITRAAFEICIARLYGGGPLLHIPSSLVPTPSQPLTPAFPIPTLSRPESTPDGYHPASPRLLLSLLATAFFLSMPAVASQALQLILRTVGPYTAVRYLNFAVGRGVGEPDEGETGDGMEAAVGLEEIAELVAEEASSVKGKEGGRKQEDGDLAQKMNELDVTDDCKVKIEEVPTSAASQESSCDHRETSMGIHKEAPLSILSDTDSEDAGIAAPSLVSALEPRSYYGAVSDKVGEAAACWLARWGVDVVRYELEVEESSGAGVEVGREQSVHVRWDAADAGRSMGGSRKRTATAPSRFAEPVRNGAGPSGSAWHNQGASAREKERERERRDWVIPFVWRCGGLSARWVRGLLSSDALFVKGEKERYDMAKTVVEMRRRKGIDEEEEREWEELFRTGIYYENMGIDDLMTISRDVSPTTGQYYVPLHVLQSAHWNQDVLRHRIMTRPSSTSGSPATPPLSPGSREKELGLSLPTTEVAAMIEKEAAFFPVPADSSVRIGDSTAIDGGSLEGLFDAKEPTTIDAAPRKTGMPPSCEENFFGLGQQRFAVSTVASSSSSSSSLAPSGKWTPHPPFRFAVEFWDVDALKEKSRLHSHTVWYAGSLYNVYVQVVRKKGVQLGVYLHRQSTVDPIPHMSAPVNGVSSRLIGVPSSNHGSGNGSNGRPSSAGASSSSVPQPQNNSGTSLQLSRSLTPTSTPNSSALGSSLLGGGGASSNTLPATALSVAPQQPYRDPRPAVSAHFSIACASATGASLTRFTSAPDVFSVSQSWGWKSSSLRTEEYMEVGPDGMPSGQAMPAGREVSLRATVVLGVV